MSYPFDQLTTLAGANRDLFLKCAEIVQQATARQAGIATRSVAALSPKDDAQVGAARTPNYAGFSEIWRDAEQSRQKATEETRAAVKNWQESVGSCFAAEPAGQQVAAAFETWTSFMTKLWPGMAAGAKDKAGNGSAH